jgi:hypothetical protein
VRWFGIKWRAFARFLWLGRLKADSSAALRDDN